jgi:hypothetical protein
MNAAQLSLQYWESILSQSQFQRGCMYTYIYVYPENSDTLCLPEGDVDCSWVFNERFAILSDIAQNATLEQMSVVFVYLSSVLILFQTNEAGGRLPKLQLLSSKWHSGQ